MASNQARTKKQIVIFLIAICFFILDRYLKFLALNNFSKTLIPYLLDFKLMINNRLALSLGPVNNQLIFILIIFFNLIIIWLYLWSIIKQKNNLTHPLTFIVFGAISNLLDRLFSHGVIDYFSIPLTVFNLADLMIMVGAILCTLNFLKNKHTTVKNDNTKSTGTNLGEKIFKQHLTKKGYKIIDSGENIIVSKGKQTTTVNKKTISPKPELK